VAVTGGAAGPVVLDLVEISEVRRLVTLAPRRRVAATVPLSREDHRVPPNCIRQKQGLVVTTIAR
jgi:hypothetical protein